MTSINGNKPVGLPADFEPTTLERVKYQPKDTYVTDAHPYLNVVADIVKTALTIPFAVLFGMGGCSSEVPLVTTGKESSGDATCDGSSASETKNDSGPALDTGFDAGSDVGKDVCEDSCTEDTTDIIVDDADIQSADTFETSDDVPLADTATTTDSADALDMTSDVTPATDGTSPADDAMDATTNDTDDAVALPNDASGDVGIAGDATIADAVAEDTVVETFEDAGSTDVCKSSCDAEFADVAADVVLPNDVTAGGMVWGPTPEGMPFCTSNDPIINTILAGGSPNDFAAMCVYTNTIEVLSFIKDINGNKKFNDVTVNFDINQFAVDFNNDADKSLKKSTSIFMKFSALQPVPMTGSLEPQFATGVEELEFKLAPDADLTWEATWVAKDKNNHDVQIQFKPAVVPLQAYLSMSYTKGQGLVSNFSYPCAFDKPFPPQGMLACPQKVVVP